MSDELTAAVVAPPRDWPIKEFTVGLIVKADGPNGSVGKVVALRTDGPFEKEPGVCVEWVYGRDVHDDVMTATSWYYSDRHQKELALATQEQYDAVRDRKGWGT